MGTRGPIHSPSNGGLLPFDPARYLTDAVAAAEYLAAAKEADDPKTMRAAIGDVRRAAQMHRYEVPDVNE